MSIAAEFSLPRTDLLLGRVPNDWTGRVEFEPSVPTPSDPLPFLRVSGDVEAFAASARADDAVDSLVELDVTSSWTRYHLSWAPEAERAVRSLLRNTVVVEAVAGERWTLCLRFAQFDELTRFRERADETRLSLEPRRLRDESRVDESASETRLTDLQRRTLAVALREGYFEVPRSATLSDLAAELDVSKQAVSERLRRAVSILAADAVEGAPPAR